MHFQHSECIDVATILLGLFNNRLFTGSNAAVYELMVGAPHTLDLIAFNSYIGRHEMSNQSVAQKRAMGQTGLAKTDLFSKCVICDFEVFDNVWEPELVRSLSKIK